MPAVKTNLIEEARRYLANAKNLLSEKAQKEGKYYQDPKYVKMAGHAAYTGMLLALDAFFGSKKGRKSVEWYQQELGKQDRKVLSVFNAAYNTLHLAMSYDGNPSVDVSKAGISDAEKLITWLENRMARRAA